MAHLQNSIIFQMRASKNGDAFSTQSDSTSISAILTVYINSTAIVQCRVSSLEGHGTLYDSPLTLSPYHGTYIVDGAVSLINHHPPISA